MRLQSSLFPVGLLAAHTLLPVSCPGQIAGLDPFAISIEHTSTQLNRARRASRQALIASQPKRAAAAILARDWLITHQQADGSWPAPRDYEVGTAGLAVLALSAEGVTLRTG